jgi:molybdate transport system substrate-binding protein
MSSGIGVAVKRGAPKPDIGTTEAFKQTLLKAKSVTYLKGGASTIHLRKLFPNWSPKVRSSSA